MIKGFQDFDALAAKLAEIPGVTRAAPLIKGQVMVTAGEASAVGVGGGAAGAGVSSFSFEQLETQSNNPATISADFQIMNFLIMPSL